MFVLRFCFFIFSGVLRVLFLVVLGVMVLDFSTHGVSRVKAQVKQVDVSKIDVSKITGYAINVAEQVYEGIKDFSAKHV